ncbi:cell division protein SepF [Prochlorococcus marinus str. MU1404]|uniref:cell division protein SepF n=1 Tax=Prochlorococcus marinus TaxID=1219 RepID=UPI001ADA66E9|nr:cell division protein SepF [Prochlorococcus marinus XMU1404]MBW3072671.1 cell division protein SepF [Prochlorococcus marinus str. MU1404]MCR8546071.1 cell division protein SepF [Prochlorococcus marinus CUG1432]
MSLISRLKAVVAGDEYLDDDFDDFDYASEDDLNDINDLKQSQKNSKALANTNPFEFMNNNRSSKVVGMPGISNSSSEVSLMEPRSFDEMPQAIQALRERKTVILNLTMMDPDQAQRAVDFIAGGTYAIDGHQERVGESIFLFAPSCVNVTSSFTEEASPSNMTTKSAPQYSFQKNTAPEPAWGDSKLSAFS